MIVKEGGGLFSNGGLFLGIYVTVHEKTKHIAQKMILELRVPWPFMMFELPTVQV